MSDATPGAAADPTPADVPAEDGAPAAGRAGAVLTYLAEQLSDDPAAVRIEVEAGRHGTRLSLRVAPDDMGRIIGRRGRTAQAIRTVVRAAAASQGADVSVDIVD